MIKIGLPATLTAVLLLLQGCATGSSAPAPNAVNNCNALSGFKSETVCIPAPAPASPPPAYTSNDCADAAGFSEKACIPANDPMANAAEQILGLEQTPSGKPLDLKQSVETGAKGVEQEFGIKPGL